VGYAAEEIVKLVSVSVDSNFNNKPGSPNFFPDNKSLKKCSKKG
jgi:hypothetical protein